MEDRLLTVIVPAYNVEKYLRECLDSLLKQTEQDHYVLIIDDGSTDGTPDICDEYVENYPTIFHCIHKKNEGLGAARNTGMENVKTPYFTFLDSDDWWNLQTIEFLKRTLKQFGSEEIDIIYTLPVIYDSLTSTYSDWHDKELFYNIFYSGNRIVSAVSDERLYMLEYSSCRKIFRTDFAKKINFKFEEGVKWEDVFPHFYSTYYAKSCIGIEEVGFSYRINTSGQITSGSGESRLDIIHTFAITLGFIINKNIAVKERNVIISRMISFLRWCIDESNQEVKEKLIKKIAELFKIVPRHYWKEYFRFTNNKMDKLFVIIMRNPVLRKWYGDYLVKGLLKNFLRKVKKVIKHG